MKGIFAFIGMTVGGWIGWVIGARVSTFTAFVLSVVGTGAGLYLANRFTGRYF
jgi:hypothetical protein